MMPSESLTDRRTEFATFVWNHAADAFQAKFDTRAKLTDAEIKLLMGILDPKNMQSFDALSAAVATASQSITHVCPCCSK